MTTAPATNPLDLSSKRILITGASSGIGRATAKLLHDLNARLILSGRNRERLEDLNASLAATVPHEVAPFDLTAADQVSSWVERLAANDPLDAIVHAAGKQLTAPVRVLNVPMLDDVLKTNLYSAYMLARAFSLKSVHKRGGGSLVFISSIMSVASRPALAAYSGSKAALSGIAKSLALELAPSRIRVNCIAPAFVETEMLASLREALPAEQVRSIENAHPLGFGSPEDIANAVAFLVADTGRWITGTTLVVDGGYSAH